MGHNVCAIGVASEYDKSVAEGYDLKPILTYRTLALLPIDHYYSTYWSTYLDVSGRLPVPAVLPATFPADRVLARIVRAICGVDEPRYAVIMTDYSGGEGGQWAVVLEGERLVFDGSINGALACLGVQRRGAEDEFDTVGLRYLRANPAYLERYGELCDALGV